MAPVPSSCLYGSLRATNRNLNTINRNWKFPTEQKKVNMLKQVAEQAWPDHPIGDCPKSRTKRDNEYYFRTTYMNPWVINRLQKQLPASVWKPPAS